MSNALGVCCAFFLPRELERKKQRVPEQRGMGSRDTEVWKWPRQKDRVLVFFLQMSVHKRGTIMKIK